MLPGADGLMGALRHFAVTVQEAQRAPCRVEVEPSTVRVGDPVVANQLYRIAQEAVRNAVRHAGGTRVTVSLRDDDDHVSLRVVDDGRGVDAGARSTTGMGFDVMRYRAGLVGGQLTIARRPEGGTEVRCRVLRPLRSTRRRPARRVRDR